MFAVVINHSSHDPPSVLDVLPLPARSVCTSSPISVALVWGFRLGVLCCLPMAQAPHTDFGDSFLSRLSAESTSMPVLMLARRLTSAIFR